MSIAFFPGIRPHGAAPGIRSYTQNASADDTSATFAVTLPTYSAGDLLVILVAMQASANRTFTTPAGWTELFNLPQTSGSLRRFACYSRRADGSEGSSVTITASAAGRFVGQSYAVAGALGMPQFEVGAQVGSTTFDPPLLTPLWGAAKNLWFASAAHQDAETLVSFPAGYDDGQQTIAQSTYVRLSTALKTATAASDNPGAFTLSATTRGYPVTGAVRIAPRSATSTLFNLNFGSTSGGEIITNFQNNATLAFDGITNQTGTNSAWKVAVAANAGYIGRFFASQAAIESATIFGSNNNGFANGAGQTVTATLYGKQGAAPANGTDGTALGSISFPDATNESAGRAITSSDPSTFWNYIWVNLVQSNNTALRMAELQMRGW